MNLPNFKQINVSLYQSELAALLKNNLAQIDTLLAEHTSYTWNNLIYPLESLSDSLERFWSPFSHLNSVMDSEELRTCYEACLPLLSRYEAAIGHNTALYEAIKSIDLTRLDSAQKKIIADKLRDFELSGVALSPEKKKRYEVIQEKLSELSNQFENNILDATQAFTLNITDEKRLEGLPEHALHTAKALADEKKLQGHVLTLEAPSYQAVMTYAKDRALRETMYHAYITKASDEGPNAGQFDNTKIMEDILALRQEEASLLGFSNYAQLSLATKMAESTKRVIEFMHNLVSKTKEQAQTEFQELEQYAKESLNITPLKPWDIAYASEQRKKSLFSLTQEDLRPYFPQTKVMKGLFAIIKKLYGIHLEEMNDADVWHKDVQCYVVIDNHNQPRGYIYTDLFARPNKHSGAWMDSLQSRRKLKDGSMQLPIATLTCNFAKASGDKPAMLSHDELTTLFHEMGHCLHHLLTKVEYLSAAGINGVEWDAVELPSQFFENWCWEQLALTLLSEHIDTKEALPSSLYDRLLAAKNFQSAMAMQRQQEYSLFDFRIHMEYDKQPGFINHVLEDVRKETSLLTPAPYNRFQHSFSHIFGGGYAAGYYSYSYAEVLSSDAFSRFEEEGIFNPATGAEFLSNILEVGSSITAKEAFKNFRGRDATIDALLRHNGINTDVEHA